MLRPARFGMGFLAGFFVCYLAGAAICFRLMLVMGMHWDDALPRAAMWMYTSRLGITMLEEGIAQHGGVKIP